MRLEKTTILVTTYNRPEGLRRLLSFWASEKVGYPIVILDSSATEAMGVNRAICEEFSSSLRVLHRGFPETIESIMKWREGVASVETEYCLFSADDDFPVPSTIAACEVFLDGHADYVVCHGFSVNFIRDPAFRFTLRAGNLSREEATPEERVWMHFHSYQDFVYGLHRTDVWKECLDANVRHVGHISGGDSCVHELLDGMLTLMKGKAKRLPLLHSLRNGLPTRESGWVVEFIYGPRFSEMVCGFKAGFSEALAKATGRSLADCERLFVEQFNNFFRQNLRYFEKPPEVWRDVLNNYEREPEVMEGVQRNLAREIAGIERIAMFAERHPLPIDFTPGVDPQAVPAGTIVDQPVGWETTPADDFFNGKVAEARRKMLFLREMMEARAAFFTHAVALDFVIFSLAVFRGVPWHRSYFALPTTFHRRDRLLIALNQPEFLDVFDTAVFPGTFDTATLQFFRDQYRAPWATPFRWAGRVATSVLFYAWLRLRRKACLEFFRRVFADLD